MTRRFSCKVLATAASSLGWFLLVMTPLASAGESRAGELIVGEVHTDDASPRAFRIRGKSPDDVVGGEIALDEQRYSIDQVSQRGMIGATWLHNAGDASFGEFVVFSSSFSEQTAVGEPWAKADRYHRCDMPYNSFLAVYRINGKAAVKAAGPRPYPLLMKDINLSDDANVYCFMSHKGADHPGTSE